MNAVRGRVASSQTKGSCTFRTEPGVPPEIVSIMVGSSNRWTSRSSFAQTLRNSRFGRSPTSQCITQIRVGQYQIMENGKYMTTSTPGKERGSSHEGVGGHRVFWNHLTVCSKAFSCPSTESGCSITGRAANPWTVPTRYVRFTERDNDGDAHRGNPRTRIGAGEFVT